MGRFLGWLLASAALALMASVSGQLAHPGEASQVQTAVGIDTDPSGNTATSLGSIEPCISVSSGQTFDVDIFVTDVPNMAGWDARLTYDGSVVNVVGMDTKLFLAANPGSNVIELSPDDLPDSDGAYGIVSADMGEWVGETGSGVLARLSLKAVGEGASALALTEVYLADPSIPPKPIGANSGGKYFGGPISGAQVWVGEACPTGPLPPLTPPPVATTATPTPVGAVISPSPATTAARTLPPATATGTASPTTPMSTVEGEDGGGFPWVMVVSAGAAAIVAASAAALVFRWLLRRAS